MGKKSGPPPPDYQAAAEKTAASQNNQLLQQTWANRPTQTDPWGSVSWSAKNAVDAQGNPVLDSSGKPVQQWFQDTKLDPRLQHVLDQQINVQGARSDVAQSMIDRMKGEYGQAMDWSQFGPMAQLGGPLQTAPTTQMGQDFGPIQRGLDYSKLPGVQGAQQNRQGAEDAIYQSAARRLDPQWQQQQAAMENQLANQGISRNSAAYQSAMDQFQAQKSDAYNQARLSAITGAGEEAQRNQQMDMALRQQLQGETGQLGQFANAAQQQAYAQAMGLQSQAFQQGLTSNQQNYVMQQQYANYQNQLRQQAINEAMQKRAFSLNEMNALLSGQQVAAPQFSGFTNAGQGQGVDYSGAASRQYDAAMQQQANQNAATGQIIGAIGTVAGGAMGGPMGAALGGALASKLGGGGAKA